MIMKNVVKGLIGSVIIAATVFITSFGSFEANANCISCTGVTDDAFCYRDGGIKACQLLIFTQERCNRFDSGAGSCPVVID
jgi:hypothetical protein